LEQSDEFARQAAEKLEQRCVDFGQAAPVIAGDRHPRSARPSKVGELVRIKSTIAKPDQAQDGVAPLLPWTGIGGAGPQGTIARTAMGKRVQPIIARSAQPRLAAWPHFGDPEPTDSTSFDQFLVNLLTRLAAFTPCGRGISQTHGVIPRCGKLLFLSRVYCWRPLLRKPILTITIIATITSLFGINT